MAAGDAGIVPGSCPNRKESMPLNSRSASLFLQNYFPTMPVQNEACKENSGLPQMAQACYAAAGNRIPNFIAVNFYMVIFDCHSYKQDMLLVRNINFLALTCAAKRWWWCFWCSRQNQWPHLMWLQQHCCLPGNCKASFNAGTLPVPCYHAICFSWLLAPGMAWWRRPSNILFWSIRVLSSFFSYWCFMLMSSPMNICRLGHQWVHARTLGHQIRIHQPPHRL